MNLRERMDEYNYDRYHKYCNLKEGIRSYYADRTGRQWETWDGHQAPQNDWSGVPPMYSAEFWRRGGARWPDEVLR